MGLIKKAKRLSSDEVYDLIKGKLIKLDFRPGQLLSEKEIISKFKLTRSPFRKAILKMEKDGIVEIIPRKGVFFKFLSIKDVIEIFQVREALEGLAAYLATDHVSLDDLKIFEDRYLKILQDYNNEEPKDVFDLGIRFHELVVHCSANHRISDILKGLKVQLEICRIFFLHQNTSLQPTRSIESIKEHLEIIKAFKRKDATLAERRMRNHIANAKKYVLTFQ